MRSRLAERRLRSIPSDPPNKARLSRLGSGADHGKRHGLELALCPRRRSEGHVEEEKSVEKQSDSSSAL